MLILLAGGICLLLLYLVVMVYVHFIFLIFFIALRIWTGIPIPERFENFDKLSTYGKMMWQDISAFALWINRIPETVTWILPCFCKCRCSVVFNEKCIKCKKWSRSYVKVLIFVILLSLRIAWFFGRVPNVFIDRSTSNMILMIYF